MPTQKDLTDLIKLLRTGTPQELGKAWRERYKTVYKNTDPDEFNTFIRSEKSGLPDLDSLAAFDGKVNA